MSASYVVRMPATAVTAAKTLIQITAGAAPLVILDAKVDQLTKTDHEQLNVQVVRKTGAATVTSATPAKLRTLDAASNASAGYNASVEGTDGDVLEDLAWNVVSGSWGLLAIDDQIVVPPAGVVALKLMTAPAAGMSLRAMVKYKELPVELAVPAQIANLRFWLKADSLSLNDGDPVTTWADSSGNGYDATQATGAQKPTYKTGIVGGKPVVRFDGSDDNLSQANGAFPWGTTKITAFFVMQTTDTSFCVWGSQKSGGTGGATFDQNMNVASGRFGMDKVGTGGQDSMASTFDSSFHVISLRDITSLVEFYSDGTAQTATTNGPFNTIDSTIACGIGARIHTASTLDFHMAGDIAEIILYERLLSAGEHDQVVDYLGAKYSITVA